MSDSLSEPRRGVVGFSARLNDCSLSEPLREKKDRAEERTQQRFVLDAPAEGSGAPAVEGALLVDVRLDGVRFAGQYVGMEELVQRVRIALADAPDRRVLVRPAERVKLQDTVRILDALSAAGVKQLSLMETAPSGGGR